MERYKDIRALALPVPQHGRFLAGCGERWLAFYRTARIAGRGREGNGNRRREGKGRHKEEEGEMSETGTGSPLNVDVPTQIIPSDRSPSTHERVIYESLFSKPVWKAFSSVIIFMLAIFEVINKDNVVSFFEKHPAILRVFIIAPIIHFFAIAAKSVLPPDTRNSLIAGFVAFFSGALFVILAIWTTNSRKQVSKLFTLLQPSHVGANSLIIITLTTLASVGLLVSSEVVIAWQLKFMEEGRASSWLNWDQGLHNIILEVDAQVAVTLLKEDTVRRL
ncbi:hypothetical protein L1049_018139 [Liquidambar formosana]|uniref:Uncharacterized protein n=1 Tax=Liquidambar formosana TaxID=63359 RepID=A0AAP0R885_LIQFO